MTSMPEDRDKQTRNTLIRPPMAEPERARYFDDFRSANAHAKQLMPPIGGAMFRFVCARWRSNAVKSVNRQTDLCPCTAQAEHL